MALTDIGVGTLERPSDLGTDGQAVWRYWMREIDNAGRIMKPWQSETDRICKIYKSENTKAARSGENFNILAANINTARPALYNSTPIPDIRKRYSDRDMMFDPATLRDAAAVLDRAITVNLEDGSFDDAMKAAVVDMLQGGRGVVRIRDEPMYDDTDELAWYRCTIERVAWDSFRHQPEDDWRKVDWIAFRMYLDRDELVKLSPSIGAKVRLDHTTASDDTPYNGGADDETDILGRACVWEIWDRRKRERLFIATSYRLGPVLREDDPYKLEDFFPVPKPIYADLDPDSLIPLPDYRLYEDQARELNRITKRIQRVVEIIKWRGIYSDTLQAVASLSNADDGDLKPVQMTDPNSNLDNSVWLMPIDRAALVLEKLYEQRAHIIETIFQITGLSDIIRGSSNPNETLGAQRIKAQWSAGRFALRQSEVSMMARNAIRLMVEMLVTQCTPQVLSLMSGIQMTPQIQTLVSSEQLRMWKLDIETDSTIQADLSDARDNIGQMVQGMGGFVQAMTPLVVGGVMPKDAAIKLLSAFTRPFRLGRSAEMVFDDLIEQMDAQQGQPQPPDPAAQADAQKMQLEQQRLQFDAQHKQATLQLEQQKAGADVSLREQDIQRQAQQHAAEMDQQDRHHQDAMDLQESTAIAAQGQQMPGQVDAEGNPVPQKLTRQDARQQAQMAHAQQLAEAQMVHSKNLADASNQNQATIAQQTAQMFSAALQQMMQQMAQQNAVSEQRQAMTFDKLASALTMVAQAISGQSAEMADAIKKMGDAVSAPRHGKLVRDSEGNVTGTVTGPIQ